MSAAMKKRLRTCLTSKKTGVVLILNEYYYTLTMPNGNNLYFTGIGSD